MRAMRTELHALRVARGIALLAPMALSAMACREASAQRRPSPPGAAQQRSFAVANCPENRPSANQACTPAATPPSMNSCPYGMGTCTCRGVDEQHATWQCFTMPVRGPLAPPELAA